MKVLLALVSSASMGVKKAIELYGQKENIPIEIDTATSINDLEAMTDAVKYDGVITQYNFSVHPYTSTELIALREKNEKGSLVIIVPDDLKGSGFLGELFNGDVRGCLYAKEGSTNNMMELILNRRSRAHARLYYGLTDRIIPETSLAQKKEDEDAVERFADLITNGASDMPEATLEERIDRVARVATKKELKATLLSLDEELQREVKKIPKYAGYFMTAKPQVRVVEAVEKKPESSIVSVIKALGDKRKDKKEADAERAEQRAQEKAELEARRAAERERDALLKKEEDEKKAAEKAAADAKRAEEEKQRAAQREEEERQRAEKRAEEERKKEEQKAEEERLKAEAKIKAEAEAAEAKKIADAQKAAELAKAEAEKKRAEAEKAKAEQAKAEAERAKAEAEKAKAEERAREIAQKEAERKHQRELERLRAEEEKQRKADERKLKLVEAKSEVIVEKRLVRSRVIGVIGLYRAAGATSAAVSLAKTISEHDAVTLIEIPKDGVGSIFTKYELGKKIGPKYKSVPHMIADGETDLSGIDNSYENIQFFVANPQNEKIDYDSQLVASMIYGTPNNVVIDLGSGISEAKKKGYLNFLSDLILVYEADQEDTYLETIRDELNALSATDIDPYIIRVQERGNSKSHIEGPQILNVRKLYTNGKIAPLAISSSEEKELLSHLNISEKKRKSLFGRTKKVIVRQGTEDIAVIGTEHGVGTTHTAFMIADSLRVHYKVALVELNTSEQMASLARELGRGKNLPVKLAGIDMYHGISYSEFADRYRSKYDFVVVDFGVIKESGKRREALALCGKKFLVFDAAPWKLDRLDNIIYQYMGDLDEAGQMVLLAPGADAELIRNYNLRVRSGKREIRPVPLVKIPLKMDEEIVRYMQKLIL